jgi:hypothetical protein
VSQRRLSLPDCQVRPAAMPLWKRYTQDGTLDGTTTGFAVARVLP